MRPTVGLMPTSMFWFDGLRIEPEVSVPTFAAQKFAAVPVPELDPPVPSTGRPSSKRVGPAPGPPPARRTGGGRSRP